MTQDREALIVRFTELASIEREAGRMYKTLLPFVTDAVDRNIVNGIMLDEKRHEEMAQEIVTLLQAA